MEFYLEKLSSPHAEQWDKQRAPFRGFHFLQKEKVASLWQLPQSQVHGTVSVKRGPGKQLIANRSRQLQIRDGRY
ncbi:hypothetical protein MTP99_000502 [Tenebrio molitor]|nr:hypothetical protein MTP99_000502 [Tenebrio molitor]